MAVISSSVATALKQQQRTSPLVVARIARMLQRGAAEIVDLSERDNLTEESCDSAHDFSGKKSCNKLLFRPASFKDK